MSALFNQTNISPGTAFATGSGGSNFSNGIIIGTDASYLTTNTLNSNPVYPTFWESNSLASLSLINAAGIQTFEPISQTTSCLYKFDTIVFEDSSGFQGFIQIDNSAPLNVNSNVVIKLSGISSITSGQYTVDANKLLSTVQGYGWA